jgi:hypothetical protein
MMFLNEQDPEVSDRIAVKIPYRVRDITLIPLANTPSVPNTQLIVAFQNLSDTQREVLREPGGDSMMKFTAEILSYCILDQMAQTYRRSWKVDVHRVANRIRIDGLPADSAKFDFHTLPSPDSTSLISEMGFDWRISTLGHPSVCLPPGTTVSVELGSGDGVRSSRIHLRLDRYFDIRVETKALMWHMGMPRISTSDYLQAEPASIETATVTLDIEFHAEFESPDLENESLSEDVVWAEQMANQVRKNWDWETTTGIENGPNAAFDTE